MFVLVLTACNSQVAPHAATGSASAAAAVSQPTGAVPTASPSAAAATSPAATSSATAAPTSVATQSGSIPVTGSGQLPQYYSPLRDAQYVSKGATIIVRYGPVLNTQVVGSLTFSVKGSKSGAHDGQVILADDQKTVIFKPNQPFTAGEQVAVQVSGLEIDAQNSYLPLTYSFDVATNQQVGGVGAATQPPNQAPQSAFPNYLTVPQDIPHFTVTKTSPDNSEGDIFVAPIYWAGAVTGAYLLILDGQGNLVYYQPMADAINAFDFKELPNGMLSYYNQKTATYYVMNSHYQVVNSYQAGDGYTADLHGIQLLPNGNALLMAYDAETVDMSKVVPGGNPNAVVTGLVVQELDPHKNVLFEWRSWDHIPFTDSTARLTDPAIDLIHGNALYLTNDGNLLISSRNLSEITKIDLQTGTVIWRMGGKANQFQFVNDQGFAFQHDIDQLPNGNITLFDNHGDAQAPAPAPSRGVEYQVDEVHKTVTKVWEYQPSPPVFATYMGDTQRLPDGSTFLDWGAPFIAPGYQFITMTEVDANNQVIFQFSFDQPYVSYRAFRAPWQGAPLTPPVLAYKSTSNGLLLGYSWNGATNVASWRLYGGTSPNGLNLVDQKARNGFETQSHLANLPQGECYFQAAALDQAGNELARSPVLSTNPAACPPGK